MADALEHAHRRGVVHRDVKPENVLLQSGHALVADFGIALALEHAGGERLTSTGITLGTPRYMAPEQASGDHVIDARTDVYALGAVLHEMLAGESPFAAASQQAMLWRVMHEPPTALATRRADVSPSLDAAVRRALAKRPDDRFPSAAAFVSALSVPTDEARDESKPSRARMVSARSMLYAAGAMLAIGLAGGWMFARSPVANRLSNIAPDVARSTIGAAAAPAPSPAGDLSLGVFDRAGRLERTIPATRAWTPRISPDGRRVVYGAFGPGRNTSDLWVTDLNVGTTQRLTDDDNDNNDPQWSPDGAAVAYSANAPGGKDLFVRKLGGSEARVLAAREGIQFPSKWARDGSALLVTEDAGDRKHDILVQPADGSAARPYAATAADETAARLSPDGRWVAYTSDESGRAEVYVDAYPRPGQRVMISRAGGVHPVWRGDGRDLYYWNDGTLMAVQLESAGKTPPAVVGEKALFHAPYQTMLNTMYDVSADGKRFVIVRP